jgi:uncharacterized protein with PIN domain
MTTPPPKPPISAEDRAQMRERCEKATPGPWHWDDSDRSKARGRVDGDMVSLAPLAPGEEAEYVEPIIQTDSGVYGPREADRAFIAAARTDLPALLDALAEAEATAETCANQARYCVKALAEADVALALERARVADLHGLVARGVEFVEQDLDMAKRFRAAQAAWMAYGRTHELRHWHDLQDAFGFASPEPATASEPEATDG